MKFTTSTLLGAAAGTLVLALPAFAHSSDHHLGVGETIVHMLSNADHSLFVLGAVAAAAMLAAAVRSVRRQR